jgi:hypothetical protein
VVLSAARCVARLKLRSDRAGPRADYGLTASENALETRALNRAAHDGMP